MNSGPFSTGSANANGNGDDGNGSEGGYSSDGGGIGGGYGGFDYGGSSSDEGDDFAGGGSGEVGGDGVGVAPISLEDAFRDKPQTYEDLCRSHIVREETLETTFLIVLLDYLLLHVIVAD